MKVSDLLETFDDDPGDNPSHDETIFNLERARYKIGAKMQTVFKQFEGLLAQHPDLVQESDVNDDGEWDDEEDGREYFHRLFYMPADNPNTPDKFPDALHHPAFNISTRNKKFYSAVKQALQVLHNLSEQDVELSGQIEQLQHKAKNESK